jgi:hypothetical protein
MTTEPTMDALLPAKSEDSVFGELIGYLNGFGFPKTSWHSGGRAYTRIRATAKGTSNLFGAITKIAKGGYLGLSSRGWLTLLAREWFSVEREDARFAQGTVRLNVAAGSGPYTVQPKDAGIYEAMNRLRYFPTSAVALNLPAGPSSTPLPYIAESPGAAYNVPLGIGTGFITPLEGVTATFTDTLSTGTWLTTVGKDEESDAALISRCIAKWNTLGVLTPTDAYLRIAQETLGIGIKPNKIVVVPGANGAVTIYLASNAGPLPTVDRDLIRARLLSMKSPTQNMTVDNAAAVSIVIEAWVHFRGGYVTAIEQAEVALQKEIAALPIGGKQILSQVLENIMAIPGVVDVPPEKLLINGVNADLQLAANQVATWGSLVATRVIL